jgi:8-oxo-dGTP pyrophosphatase MutT (NUDIX family)
VSERSITRVATLDIRCVERDWPWAEANAREIDAFWRAATAEQPKMFDGPVFVFADIAIENDCCRAVCFETRFSRLLYAKQNGFPDPGVTNGFAMGALRADDGAFLLGVMGPHTANPGQAYFAAGTPDPSDRKDDGTLDLLGSIARELAEETGLQPGEYEVGQGWVLVRDGGRLAFLRPVRVAGAGHEVRARMLGRIARMKEQELSDIRLVHGTSDIDQERMPPFIQAFLLWAFAQLEQA